MTVYVITHRQSFIRSMFCTPQLARLAQHGSFKGPFIPMFTDHGSANASRLALLQSPEEYEVTEAEIIRYK